MVENAKNVEERAREVLVQIRPYLEADQVQCELVKIEGETAYVRLTTEKVSCATELMTIKMGIEYRLCEAVSEIKLVEPI